jgi:hypothetical protein
MSVKGGKRIIEEDAVGVEVKSSSDVDLERKKTI